MAEWKRDPYWTLHINRVAEGKRFELLVSCPTHAFQACALDRYANPPLGPVIYSIKIFFYIGSCRGSVTGSRLLARLATPPRAVALRLSILSNRTILTFLCLGKRISRFVAWPEKRRGYV